MIFINAFSATDYLTSSLWVEIVMARSVFKRTLIFNYIQDGKSQT